MEKIKVIYCENKEQGKDIIEYLKSIGGINKGGWDSHTFKTYNYIGIDERGNINGWMFNMDKFEIIELPKEKTYSLTADQSIVVKDSEGEEAIIYKHTADQLKAIAEGKGEEVCPEVFAVKENKIASIKRRIVDEHRKHKDLDWAQIAAQKIYSSFIENNS